MRAAVVNGLGSGRVRVLYDGTLIGLALVVVALLFLEDVGWVRAVNLTIWAVFVFDYVVRLLLSTDKRAFVRANIIELLAILPVDQFRTLRLLRVFRLFRAVSVLTRVMHDLRGIRDTNGLGWVLGIAAGAVSASAATVWVVEPSIESLGDAFWWAFVTATTVGYGDVSVNTTAARLVAVVLMLVGIGTIGMLTASIATYFLSGLSRPSSPHIEHLQGLLVKWDDLSPTDRRAAANLLTHLAGESVVPPAGIEPT